MRVFISYLSKMKIVSRFLFFALALFTAGFNHFLLWTYLNSSMTRSLTNILPPLSNLNDLNSHVSWCLGVGGQIDGKNPNKLTPRPKWDESLVFGVEAIWCCSFLFMYWEKWEVTGKWNQSGSSEDYDSLFSLNYCCIITPISGIY